MKESITYLKYESISTDPTNLRKKNFIVEQTLRRLPIRRYKPMEGRMVSGMPASRGVVPGNQVASR